MKPKKTTIENEKLEEAKAHCDEIIHRAALMMVEDIGVSIPMMLDRIFTFAAAQAFSQQGKAETIKIFNVMAQNIENGAFDALFPQGRGKLN